MIEKEVKEQTKKPKKINWLRVLIIVVLIVVGAWIYFLISVSGANPSLGGFCGSFEGICGSDADCFATGCSSQICSNKEIVTTCEWRDCYDNEAYGASCACSKGKCGWINK